MGADPAEAATAIRVSFGWASATHDVERFALVWSRLYARTRSPERGRGAGAGMRPRLAFAPPLTT
jgi:cysteine sulfinate desulfinase/cysteine desulfurase-like protein